MKKTLSFAFVLGFAIAVGVGIGLGIFLTILGREPDYRIYLIILYASSFLISLLTPTRSWFVVLGLLLGQLAYLFVQGDMYKNAFWIIGIVAIIIVSFSSLITSFLGQLLRDALFTKKNRKP